MQQRKLQMPNKFPQKVSISRKTSANTGSRYTWKTVSTSQSGNLRFAGIATAKWSYSQAKLGDMHRSHKLPENPIQQPTKETW